MPQYFFVNIGFGYFFLLCMSVRDRYFHEPRSPGYDMPLASQPIRMHSSQSGHNYDLPPAFLIGQIPPSERQYNNHSGYIKKYGQKEWPLEGSGDGRSAEVNDSCIYKWNNNANLCVFIIFSFQSQTRHTNIIRIKAVKNIFHKNNSPRPTFSYVEYKVFRLYSKHEWVCRF